MFSRTHAPGKTRVHGFTMLELLMVVALILVVSAMAIPSWVRMNRAYRLRNDVDRITGVINASRMRGGATFARVKIDCSQADTVNCKGSSAACSITLLNYQTGNSQTPTLDSPQQRVCLSPGVSFALPSTTFGVQTQYNTAPVQSQTLYFNSLGFPITSSGGTNPNYAMYLQEAASGNFMAIGIAPNGKPVVYTLSGNTWLPNQ